MAIDTAYLVVLQNSVSKAIRQIASMNFGKAADELVALHHALSDKIERENQLNLEITDVPEKTA